jgi:hypothetical protein
VTMAPIQGVTEFNLTLSDLVLIIFATAGTPVHLEPSWSKEALFGLLGVLAVVLAPCLGLLIRCSYLRWRECRRRSAARLRKQLRSTYRKCTLIIHQRAMLNPRQTGAVFDSAGGGKSDEQEVNREPLFSSFEDRGQ